MLYIITSYSKIFKNNFFSFIDSVLKYFKIIYDFILI